MALDPQPECTGLNASWCPIHGDCTCPRDEDGTTRDWYDETQEGKNRPDCPLHGTTTAHAALDSLGQVYAREVAG